MLIAAGWPAILSLPDVVLFDFAGALPAGRSNLWES